MNKIFCNKYSARYIRHSCFSSSLIFLSFLALKMSIIQRGVLSMLMVPE